MIDGAEVRYADGRIVATADHGVGLVTINNPARRNAMSLAMWDGLGEAIDAFDRDDDVRVVILTGAGPEAFMSGADISEFGAEREGAEARRQYDARTGAIRARLSAFRKPMIARIRGHCLGGGLALAMQADIRIAATDSSFGVPAARLGIAYGPDAVRRLIAIVGPAHARMILYVGRRFDAAEASRIGLVNEVVADADLSERVLVLARTIADNAPLSVAASKLTIDTLLRDPGERDMAAIEHAIDACFESEDYAEGRRAFAEKRPPKFSGR